MTGGRTSDGVRAGREFDAQLHLLDRQVLDVDGEPVLTVDDVELEGVPTGELAPGTPAPVVVNLLTGPVLGTRIFGGRPPSSRWLRVPWSEVADIGIVLRLKHAADRFDASWTERWVRDHVIRRIPGGSHDPE